MGPNFKKLCIHVIARDAIPEGGGILDGVQFLLDRKKIKQSAQGASVWVHHAIEAIRQAPGDNPWRDADDEAICGEILRLIEEKKRSKS